MPTFASTLGATSTITALASIGFVLTASESHPRANTDANDRRAHAHGPASASIPGTARPAADMSATATAVSTFNAHPHLFAELPARRSHGRRSRSSSTNTASTTLAAKRHSYTGLSVGMDRSSRRPQTQEEHGVAADTNTSATGSAANSKWFRRLSSSLSSSRDSSRTPTSRPPSAAISHSNGSITPSVTGSSTPMVADSTPPTNERPLAANKLVKRTTSLSSTHGSPNSRIPIFRRPATSHQRSATLHERLSGSGWDSPISRGTSSPSGNASHWRSYFSPEATREQSTLTRRRNSTGIPNPVRRMFPDRKYTPTLVSAKEPVRVSTVEAPFAADELETFHATTEVNVAQSTASSPFPNYVPFFEESASPRRSFSIGDLLSTGPQPLWRRPSTSNGRPWSARSNRRLRPASMGGLVSRNIEPELERPAKRRDLTDPTSSQRSIYSSSSSEHPSSSDPAYEVDLQLGGELPQAPYSEDETAPAPGSGARTPDHHRLPPESAFAPSARQPRISATYSEIASTVGSESERRSLGDNSTDYQSDVYYDSIPTRTTRSSSGRRGPPIETIFDESPPTFSSGRSTKLRDFLSDGHEHNNARYSTIEEEGSVVSTPVRSLRNKSITSTPSARPGATHIFSSSPPTMRLTPDMDDDDWDADNDGGLEPGLGIQRHDSMPSFGGQTTTQTLPFRFGPALRFTSSRSANSTPYRNGYSPMEKPNLFDWSEPQPSPSHPQQSPPRPRTVHGKKDQDSRGSRPAGRRPVSGMHARSHSVPVVPDFDNKRSNVVANKFGTWGVGSKGVTEDWNDDFDFDELPEPVQDINESDSRRIDSGHVMFVPKSIREQQENVVANISLLREWGLLIEELKELRIRAVALNMLTGTYAQSWREVDAMIELADQESEEHTIEPRRTPPSSPGFDVSAFEEVTPIKSNVKAIQPQLSADVSPTRGQKQGTTIVTRPRKDSELVAQKVIAALQSRRITEDSPALSSIYPTNKKVPFDTATLRHIVPYVSSLKRKVKDALRETEGLYTSPNRRRSPTNHEGAENMSDEEPAFRSIFNSPQDDDVTNRRLSRRKQATTDHDGSGSPLMSHGAGLDEMMQDMSLPS
ncbi:hypothetical protein CB0940_00623 [Cercospora beticola]|uniref:Uncharacterized protein n=1 Tax=Cercospora beticola TaxID=122368 RepID=A0A2G5IBI8_CERBT|nr:hypothetical protein CB0940_00623 [Cercospora beticola]PIB01823.1 hypothetical protein CB0940_00623 [Cercospora beticola]WPA96046.1 hypothetical protein RHO25_000652 [Cercospora beticola]